MLRDRGIHILDNFPCFLTTAHTDEDIETIVAAYRGRGQPRCKPAGFFPAARTAARPSKAARVRAVPSTEPQREVWLADRLGPEASLAYNESVSLHLRGELDVGALRHAVRELPRRHDALRSDVRRRRPDLAASRRGPRARGAARAISARCRARPVTPSWPRSPCATSPSRSTSSTARWCAPSWSASRRITTSWCSPATTSCSTAGRTG